jgi:hypothetical protein
MLKEDTIVIFLNFKSIILVSVRIRHLLHPKSFAIPFGGLLNSKLVGWVEEEKMTLNPVLI